MVIELQLDSNLMDAMVISMGICLDTNEIGGALEMVTVRQARLSKFHNQTW